MSQWDPTYMVLPSMSCQASCTYCFGPHKGPMMDELTAEKTVEFIARTSRECSMDSIRVVFHGGEPLLAPVEIWKILLEGLDSLRKETKVRLSVQSNLWALNDELLELFRRYEVHLGTSLDGPKKICDINRGERYYERTYASIEKARQHRRDTGVICTLTGESLPHLKEIMEFFRDRALTPVLHCAVKALGKDNDPSSL
ncbi:MAG: radical SAM protein, partial [Eubacteriaceae bacterium]|nr:radical SAM protein [Eubacteriaceae bacterium]